MSVRPFRGVEAAERLVREFLLPNCFGFYDVWQMEARNVISFGSSPISSSRQKKIAFAHLTLLAGVRALRGEPEQKLREWVGRFCGMDWLVAEEGRLGAPPKAWQVMPGLREHFAERQKQAQAARAEAHEIMKAGGSRRSHRA